MDQVMIELVGGPAGLPEEARLLVVPAPRLGERIAVPYRAGYEHFEYADDQPDVPPEGSDAAVVCRYVWCYHTAIAE
ncbi:DUF5988 family protein [Nonomuraea sp. NPDC050556]|uniref:DUF5988 family protein n=1 Tax=Nonomuraea sp. NPDC050556 TaxID=3364369 RepID=UPI00379ECAB8